MNIMEAARLAGVTDKTMRRAIRSGKIAVEYPRVNNASVSLADLNAYIASRQTIQHVQVAQPNQPAQSGQEQRIALLEAQVQSLQSRVTLLEKKDGQHRTVKLADFALLHNVSEGDIQRARNMQVIPVGKHDTLNAKQRRAFWEAFHDIHMWISCKDCPHDVQLMSK